MNQEDWFKVGDIVWGKVNGYPWWPGKIIAVPKIGKSAKITKNPDKPPVKIGHYHVRFIGHESWSELPFEKVEDFSESYTKYSQTKDKKLKDAINQTQRLVNPSSAKKGKIAPLSAEIKSTYSNISKKKAVEIVYEPEQPEEVCPH